MIKRAALSMILCCCFTATAFADDAADDEGDRILLEVRVARVAVRVQERRRPRAGGG
jgi:hypothetical protein